MNLLEHAHPAGVEINTFNIRRQHVFLDPGKPNEPNPLKSSVANTFRLFRRRRHRGEIAVTL